MGADYRPGTVAKATVRDVPDVTVMAGYGTSEPKLRWLTTDERLVDEYNDGWYFAFDVTDVRPLVVLAPSAVLEEASSDPDGEVVRALRNLAKNDRHNGHQGYDTTYRARIAEHLADQIEEQTKPPRIPEPGLWGVVEASAHDSARFEWVRHPEGWTATTMTPQQWSDLIDPVLIREGVES